MTQSVGKPLSGFTSSDVHHFNNFYRQSNYLYLLHYLYYFHADSFIGGDCQRLFEEDSLLHLSASTLIQNLGGFSFCKTSDIDDGNIMHWKWPLFSLGKLSSEQNVYNLHIAQCTFQLD